MVKISKVRLIIGIVILLAAGAAGWYFFQGESDEQQIRRTLQEITLNLTKRSGDGTTSNLLNSNALAKYFATRCQLSIGSDLFNGELSPEAVTANSMRMRALFQTISPSISDLYLELAPDHLSATADFTAKFRGVLNNGSKIEATRDLRCHLTLEKDHWKIDAVTIREILEK